jgi:uncharacterized LabA/DUF88 family protein
VTLVAVSNEEPQGSLFYIDMRVSEARRQKKRVAVFIDGSNLHHRLVQCGWPAEVDISGFANKLVGGRRLVKVYYYNVPPPRTHKKAQRQAQDRYYARIRSQSDVLFRLGYLQEKKIRGKSVFEEKEVDVQLTVDMLSGAYQNRYDTAILVSSDGDFAPAVMEVQRRNKRVEYVYFPVGTRSSRLNQVCDVSRECRASWAAAFGP